MPGEPTKPTLLLGLLGSNRDLRFCFLGQESMGGVEGDEEFIVGLVPLGAGGPHRGGWVGGPEERSRLSMGS